MSSEFQVTKKSVTLASGLVISYHESGDDNAKVLVLLHGSGPGGSGLGNFESNYRYFVARGYRTLMPDVIGWGESSKPEGVEYDYPLVAGSLLGWLAALGIESCHVVGNSMGGALAIRLALEEPELVKGLVLLAPGGLGEIDEYMVMPGIQAIFSSMTSDDEITAESLRGVFELMYHEPGKIDMALVTRRAAIANTQTSDTYKNYKMGNQLDSLSELRCPILIFWGTSDRFCPIETGARILERCPRSRMVTVNQCGHWVQLEQKDVFNRLTLDFLEND